MSVNYIGLSCTFHDPALAIVDSQGKVVFSEASERHLQNKRAFNYPPDNISYIMPVLEKYCDPEADLVIAKSWSANTIHRIRFMKAITSLFPQKTLLCRLGMISQSNALNITSMGVKLKCWRDSMDNNIDRRIDEKNYEHHLVHAVTGCYTSPFKEALCAVIDGFGEGTSTAFFHYRDGKLKPLTRFNKSLNSLGFFYLALCSWCGFEPIHGEEWKVMGLAPYGKFSRKAYKILRPLVKIKGLKIVNAHKLYSHPFRMGRGSVSIEDMAYTGQLVFEECMKELLDNLHKLGLSDNLVLSGGCALNSSCNGKILEETGFERLHVYSAPADDGNALGAALLAYHTDHPDKNPSIKIQSPYLGEEISNDKLERWTQLDRSNLIKHLPGKVHEEAARKLAEGKIIGWVQGKAEFGPRALGNRSILADPRQPGIKDRINSLVKFREEFRPFAPAILHEYGDEYFENYQESPYMERTLRFRDDVLDKIPGVVHINKTGRLQSVKREWNRHFYDLLVSFHRITSVPVLLNTSLNVMGKPIIHSLEDAVAVFMTTGLDVLVIGDYLVEKRSSAPASIVH